jgi:hypothetical protein
MDCYSEIIGYHANDYEKCNRFLEGGFDVSLDTCWLGNGMYFWDNLANAKFWRREKVRKGDPPHLDACKIIAAKISCEDFFDFTDEDIREKFANLWRIAKTKLSKDKIRTMQFGRIIDYVFNFYPDLQQCPVVKIHADYSKTQENPALFGDTKFTGTIKTIYSVRHDSAIIWRRNVDNYE